MSTAIAARPWDLDHLQHFLPAIQDHAVPADGADQDTKAVAPLPNSYNVHHDDGGDVPNTRDLGNFSKIYNILGTSDHSAVHTGFGLIPAKDDYASDGAIHQVSGPTRHHTITPNLSDGMDGVEAVFGFDQSDSESMTAPKSSASNSQRKKERKKAREEEQRAKLAAQRTTLYESEGDGNIGRETSASKAASHSMMTRSMNAKMQMDDTPAKEQAVRAVAEAAARLKERNMPETPCPTRSFSRTPMSDTRPPSASRDPAYTDEPPSTAFSAQHQLPPSTKDSPYLLPIGQPNFVPTRRNDHSNSVASAWRHNLIPSSVQPLQNNATATSASQHTYPPRPARPAAPPLTIQPITVRLGEERELALFLKLINNFYPDRKHLAKPANLITHNSDPAGIHVFVDASNIFIGFVDQLKRSRNIHPRHRVPDVNLSFDSLALLIERRRPVAKRVLVGSTPHLPAFDKAKAVGYEVSILEKVMKARELSERQIYFKEDAAGRKSSTKPPPHKIALQGSVLTPAGSETTTTPEPQFAPVKLVEQGVDEILHLKMAESIIDTEQPGIMVLATGDAAQAEYSSGFAAMVERALRNGWSVELISWSKNINCLYKNKRWEDAWGERFRIIELDSYAEELLDM